MPCDILMVEDNEPEADLVREMLGNGSSATFTVRHVTRLSAAVSALSDVEPDVALLDLSLPDSVGSESVFTLHKANPRIPIIVLTGRRDDDLAAACVAAGADDYLCKGEVQAGTLRRAIRVAIERSRQSNQRQAELVRELANVFADIVTICASCKSVHEGEKWIRFETFVGLHTGVKLNHGLCPQCVRSYFPEVLRDSP